MSSLWDTSLPSSTLSTHLQALDTLLSPSYASSPPTSPSIGSNRISIQSTHEYNSLYTSLTSVESSCSEFICRLDDILGILDEVGDSHKEITGRTNVLMNNCEALLEQQHSLAMITEKLKEIITPFNEVEAVASALGIPVDAAGRPVSVPSHQQHVDPRSAAFKDILTRTAHAIRCLHAHPDIKDADKYMTWLWQLQRRADSMTAKAMGELMEGAARACREDQAVRDAKKNTGTSDPTSHTPLESMYLYTKFRGLGFRMRELCDMLRCSEFSHENGALETEWRRRLNSGKTALSSSDYAHRQDGGEFGGTALSEVLKAYAALRCELLLPVIKDSSWGVAGDALRHKVGSGHDAGESSSTSALCSSIRSAYGLIFRAAQLEQQLYVSLFRKPSGGAVINSPKHSSNDSSQSQSVLKRHTSDISESDEIPDGEENSEVTQIVAEISSLINGQLRTLIIRETSVESLCRVILTLTQDVSSQLQATRLSKSVFDLLEANLRGTVSDARERLLYCSEVCIRQQIQMFDPLPSQLAYPDILEKASSDSEDVLSSTWFPPLKDTLSLLSQLYGAVSTPVFEDIARRAVTSCLQCLQKGAAGVRRWKTQIHGDLFLVRHLLILREQLMPFDMNLMTITKHLDFKPTSTALSAFMGNSRSLLRFDGGNSLLQMARDGLPGMQESQLDIRKHMDEVLKTSCQSLKFSALHFLLGPLEGFLAKVTAFIGDDIPVYRGDIVPNPPHNGPNDVSATALNGQEVLIPEAARNGLKKQQFVKPERILTVLNTAVENCIESKPQFSAMIKLYIDNGVTRSVIIKPVLQEIQLAKKRMGTVIQSCVDHGQPRRDLENLLNSINFTLNDLGI